MTFDINLTKGDFTYMCLVGLVALAINLGYCIFKVEDNLLELSIATLAAEAFILCMWLMLVGLNNL